MHAMLIARFDGDVAELAAAYDRAHALIMSRGGAAPSGELRHHCATDGDSLYIIGVWESEEHIRRRWSSDEFNDTLRSVGFPSPDQAEMTILHLHAIEPPSDQDTLHKHRQGTRIGEDTHVLLLPGACSRCRFEFVA
jgi:hypothetical protein